MNPAEFLTLMHMSNEEESRLSTSDSERFLVMHRLSQLHRDKKITKEVYHVNQERLARAVVKDATRHGLSNLIRAPELADAVARVLQYPHLCPNFNASTWGKKLVKGRFYNVGVLITRGTTFSLCQTIWLHIAICVLVG